MKTQEAIQAFGSIKELAVALGITQPAIYQWGVDVPPLRAYQINDLLAKRAKPDNNEQQAA
jgi:hypothetical protein